MDQQWQLYMRTKIEEQFLVLFLILKDHLNELTVFVKPKILPLRSFENSAVIGASPRQTKPIE